MNTLVHNSITNREDIPIICKETLSSIGMLDNYLSDLSTKIDNLVENFNKPKETSSSKSKNLPIGVRSSKRVASQMDSTNDDSSDPIKEINCYKDMIENISARKVTLATRAYDFLDHTVKCVDEEIKVIEKAMKLNGYEIATIEELEEEGMLGKKSRTSESSTSLEPVYCICRNIAHGDMISCDNEKCNIEWFHFACVGLTKLPKGDWFCKTCKSALNKK